MLHFNQGKVSNKDTTDYRFYYQNIPSSAIIVSWADMFMYIILALVLVMVVFLLTLCTKQRRVTPEISFFKRIMMRLINYLHHENQIWISNMIRIGIEIYIDCLFSSLFNLINLGYTNGVDIYSSIVAICWMFVVLLFTLFLLYFAVFAKKITDKVQMKKSKIRVLYNHLNLNKKWSTMIHAVFVMLRVSLVSLALLFQGNGFAQLVSFSFVMVWVLIFKFTIRPYDEAFKNLQDLIGYSLIFVLLLMYFNFLNSSNEFATKGKGFVLGISWVSITLAIIGYYNVFAVIVFVKACIRKKVKKVNAPTSTHVSNAQRVRTQSMYSMNNYIYRYLISKRHVCSWPQVWLILSYQ